MVSEVLMMSRLLLAIGLLVLFQPTVTALQSVFEDTPVDYPNVANGFRARDFNVDRHYGLDADIARDVQKTLPNMPITFWMEKKHENLFYKNRSCAKFPPLHRVEVNNLYYQIFHAIGFTVYLFGAYYDVRSSNPVGPAVRVLGMVERSLVQQQSETYCQVWYTNSSEPTIVRANYFTLWSQPKRVKGYYYPVLITCPVPSASGHQVPMFVSLVQSQCESSTNSLQVIYNKLERSEYKGRFAVCVRIMDLFEWDQSARIIEWIELVKLLGAKKVFFYPLTVHENITKVFHYYARQGTVQETPITLAGGQPNLPGLAHLYIHNIERNDTFQNWMNELISLNDCFYKNMYRYDYIVLLDIDEVIMPMKEVNWDALLRAVSMKAKGPVDAYLAKPTHFRWSADDNASGRKENIYSVGTPFKDIPSYMYMLQRVLREEEHWSSNFKTFFNTESVEVVQNHVPLKCLKGNCMMYVMEEADAQLQHYHVRGKPKSLVRDTTIWRYKKPLIDHCLATYYHLGYFK